MTGVQTCALPISVGKISVCVWLPGYRTASGTVLYAEMPTERREYREEGGRLKGKRAKRKKGRKMAMNSKEERSKERYEGKGQGKE